MSMRPQDMQKMLRQVQQMQEKMAATQAELGEQEFTATAGGGAVTAVVNGRGELLSVQFAPEVVDPDDVEMLGDLVVAAVNQAVAAANESAQNAMGQLTAGLGLPDLPLG